MTIRDKTNTETYTNADIKHKICKICNRELQIQKFDYNISHLKRRITYNNQCMSCTTQKSMRKWTPEIKIYKKQQKCLITKKAKQNYQIGYIAPQLYENYKYSDKTHQRQFNLTIPFIKSMIINGCSYCKVSYGEDNIGLDRINNKLGHIIGNVIPCCYKCNYTRKNMPFAAWLLIVPTLEIIRKNGLWKKWII